MRDQNRRYIVTKYSESKELVITQHNVHIYTRDQNALNKLTIYLLT